MIEKKIRGYAAQFIIFSILYLMIFGVGISIIFYDKPIVAIVWFTLILTIVLIFMYYSSTRVIYKVEYNENNLIFYSCLKRYKTNRKVEFQEKTIGCFVLSALLDSRIRLHKCLLPACGLQNPVTVWLVSCHIKLLLNIK